MPYRISLLAIALASLVGCDVGLVAEPVPDMMMPPPERPDRPPPPPIVGGGLAVSPDDRFALVADIDRDVLWVVDLDVGELRHRIAFEDGAQPNRIAFDARGAAHIVLRGAGAVVTVDPEAGAVLGRHAPCAAPRGIAYHPARDAVLVACAHGDLVERALDSGAERRVTLGPDLRDVVVDGERVIVSTFRGARVSVVDLDTGAAEPLQGPTAVFQPVPTSIEPRRHSPQVAWRLARHPAGGVRVLHQQHLAETLPAGTPTIAYYNAFGCGSGVVDVTVSDPDAPALAPQNLGAGLLVDLAVRADGRLAVAVAGESGSAAQADPCVDDAVRFEAEAVAWAGELLLGHSRSESVLMAYSPPGGSGPWRPAFFVRFQDRPVDDIGHRRFHRPTGSGVACAHCHPEAGDDGHVWVFEEFGPRRTQSLRGGLSDRAPFHWGGDLADFGALMDEVFVARMLGDPLDPNSNAALLAWLDTVPDLPPRAGGDRDHIAQGRALFEGLDCVACHRLDGSVDPESHDVGTGEPLQVPALAGLRLRLPLMHDGCAPTIADRFDPACGGDARHGDLAGLSDDGRVALLAFLESL